MGLHKILKIVAIILGVLGLVFLVRIIAEGDEAIKASGDASIVDPMAYITYVIMALAVGFVVVFMLKNLFTNTATLKNTLIGVGIFLAVLVISYMVSGGDTKTYLYGGEAVTEGESHLVGAGLIAFYILIIVAAVSMLFAGAKKITNR